MARSLIFRQLFEHTSCTYTYILGCAASRQALIIDPVIETVDRDVKLFRENDLNLIYGLNTHVHADHVTGTGRLKRVHNFPDMKSVLSSKCGVKKVDMTVQHGDLIRWGNDMELEVRETPGHTNGCLTFVSHQYKMAFTGDALMIRGCGRTDFQQGDARKLYRSIHEQILSLPSEYLLYPAHDYLGLTVTSVMEEKKHNPRVIKPEEEFVKIMENLKLPKPKQIGKAVPANMVCGIAELMDDELFRKVFVNEEPNPNVQGA